MKKNIVLFGLLFLTITGIAQTRVFKEVSNEISSETRTIQLDNAVLGYVTVTQLEKANADSFNYRITIIDENLNDIGVINFREQWLSLKDVTMEGDVLCLAYIKNNYDGKWENKGMS